jgi:hypothetical protein
MEKESFLVRQISVFLDNKPGSLAKMTRHLAAKGVNLRALSLIETREFSTARIIVHDPDKCMDILKKADYRHSETYVLVIAVSDKVGGMADMLEIIAGEHVNVDYVYSLVDAGRGVAGIILRTSDPLKAGFTLKAKGVKLLGSDDITA